MGLTFLALYSKFHVFPEEVFSGFGWVGGSASGGWVRQIPPPAPLPPVDKQNPDCISVLVRFRASVHLNWRVGGQTAGTTCGAVGHPGLTHTETRGGRWWTTAERRCVGSENRQNDPRNNQHNPRYANYWAPLTRKRHPPQPAQPRHTNHWAPRTRGQTPAGAPAAAADRTQ